MCSEEIVISDSNSEFDQFMNLVLLKCCELKLQYRFITIKILYKVFTASYCQLSKNTRLAHHNHHALWTEL
jgi:hypothetical protein